jgi:hypothetical protein
MATIATARKELPMTIDCQHECFIVPPDVVAVVGDRSAKARRAADNTLAASAAIRVRRDLATSLLQQMNVRLQQAAFFAPPPHRLRRPEHDGPARPQGAR